MHYVENEDVVGAAPKGDAPTISEWSTILLPTRMRLILEVSRYFYLTSSSSISGGILLINLRWLYILSISMIILSCVFMERNALSHIRIVMYLFYLGSTHFHPCMIYIFMTKYGQHVFHEWITYPFHKLCLHSHPRIHNCIHWQSPCRCQNFDRGRWHIRQYLCK